LRFKSALLFCAGLLFLLLAKVKHSMLGYSSPKPFDLADTERCATYDIEVVDGWLTHLGDHLGADANLAIAGKDVLELGPGSDLGIGLYLLSKGVRTYSACDVNDLAVAAPDEFYEVLLNRVSLGLEAGRVDQLRADLASTREGRQSPLNYVVREDFDLVEAFGENVIDIVFSQAAFEHFDDFDATVRSLSAVCRSGAVIVAQIDLKTHSRWIRDKDPNNIYRYPEWLYSALAFRGAPNRVRPNRYVNAFERHGWTGVTVTPVSRLGAFDDFGVDAAFRDRASQMDLLSVVLCARRARKVSGGGSPKPS